MSLGTRTTLLLALTWGCASGNDGPAVPADAEARTMLLSFAGREAGTEQWWAWDRPEGERVRRDRTWVLQLDGERREVHTRTELTLDDAGRVMAWSWTDGASEHAWTGVGWLPAVRPPPASGTVAVFDPDGRRVVATEVTVGDTGVRWTAPSGVEASATHDGFGPVRVVRGPVTLTRVTERPEIAPLDVLSLLRVPTEPLREGALVGRFTVDGVSVVRDAPVWAEVADEPVASQPSSGPEALRAEAASMIGDTPSRREAVRSLVRAVAGRLDGRPTPGTGDALQALRSGRGDCTEHADLLVALARAAGIPARVRGGLVYRDGVAGPGLYPHAWSEVHLGGAWVAVDAALGQVPADATHLPLGDDLPAALRRLAGGVEVRVVEVR